MLKYGSDKPDLRIPLEIVDVTDAFAESVFKVFAKAVAGGAIGRAVPAPGGGAKPRSWFDGLNDWAREEGAAGLGYIVFEAGGGKGPIARNLEPERVAAIRRATGLKDGDAVFFAFDRPEKAAKFADRKSPSLNSSH